jgi:hypothetical protein
VAPAAAAAAGASITMQAQLGLRPSLPPECACLRNVLRLAPLLPGMRAALLSGPPPQPPQPHPRQLAAAPAAPRAQALLREAEDTALPSRTLLTASVAGWAPGVPFPLARVLGALGPAGDLRSEVVALLSMEGLGADPEFPPEVPQPGRAAGCPALLRASGGAARRRAASLAYRAGPGRWLGAFGWERRAPCCVLRRAESGVPRELGLVFRGKASPDCVTHSVPH